MSTEHKAALVRGRREAKAIKDYLEAMGSRRPGRPVTSDTLKKKLVSIEERLNSEEDVLRRVDLLQAKIEAESSLAATHEASDLMALEKAFVSVVAAYSERKTISYGAWRQAGVPAAVLKKAKIARTRRSRLLTSESLQAVVFDSQMVCEFVKHCSSYLLGEFFWRQS
jgi:hypothetical protein